MAGQIQWSGMKERGIDMQSSHSRDVCCIHGRMLTISLGSDPTTPRVKVSTNDMNDMITEERNSPLSCEEPCLDELLSNAETLRLRSRRSFEIVSTASSTIIQAI